MSFHRRLGQAFGLVKQRLEDGADVALEIKTDGQSQPDHRNDNADHALFEQAGPDLGRHGGIFRDFLIDIHNLVQQVFGSTESSPGNLQCVVAQLFVGRAFVSGAVSLAQADGFQGVFFPGPPGRDELFPECRLFRGLGERFIYFPGLLRLCQFVGNVLIFTLGPGHRQIGSVQGPLRRLDCGLCLLDDQQVLDTRQTNHGDLLLKSHELVDAVVTEDAHGCRNNGHQTEAGDDFLS